ncbi:MAG: CoA transferase [Chloroflexota bacterium]|nr:CoA transferase [Chloroflexota bacterium]
MNTQALPLIHYRALDLSDEKGFLCGRILGDFGAEVIKIEKPGGDRSRNIGPFYHDIPDPEKSLYWFAYNANKRGITLNIETKEGQEVFKRLAKDVDFIIESFPPGYMAKLGLDYAVLSELNPRIIMTSITPFGQSGPYRDYKTCDLVYMSMGGSVYIAGDADRAPLRLSIEQAYLQAGAQAAAATMIAHHHRQTTGEGQYVDVSIEESAACSAHLSSFFWDIGKDIAKRQGSRVFRGKVSPRIIWHCKDGFFSWRIWVAGQGSKTKAMVEWMNSEGKGADLQGIKWEEIDFGEITQQQLEDWEESFTDFFLIHTKAEIYEEAIKRGMILFPVNNAKDLREDEQLEARGFWKKIDHPELGTALTYPGAALKSSKFYYGVRHRAPLIGEHNGEVYSHELGFSTEELIMLKEGGVI